MEDTKQVADIFLKGDDFETYIQSERVIRQLESLANNLAVKENRKYQQPIHVSFSPHTQTDGRTIFLSSALVSTFPVDSKTKILFLLGLLYHERLHLEYTDFHLMDILQNIEQSKYYSMIENKPFSKSICKDIWNILEDTYIEWIGKKVYSGVLPEMLETFNEYCTQRKPTTVFQQIAYFFIHQKEIEDEFQEVMKPIIPYYEKLLHEDVTNENRLQMAIEITLLLADFVNFEEEQDKEEQPEYSSSNDCDTSQKDLQKEQDLQTQTNKKQTKDSSFEQLPIDEIYKAMEKEKNFDEKLQEEQKEIRQSESSTETDIQFLNIPQYYRNPTMQDTYRQIAKRYQRIIATLTEKFRALLQDNYEYYEQGTKTGLLSSNRLSFYQQTDRIFKKRIQAKDTTSLEVALAVDFSGSMGVFFDEIDLNPIHYMVILSEVFERLNIRHTFIGFQEQKEFKIAVLKTCEKDKYSLLFSERYINGGSYDTVAISYLRKHFFSCADKKLLFVLTDGYPETSKYTKEQTHENMSSELNLCRQNGIDVMAISLVNNPSVNKNIRLNYGSNFVSVSNTNELVTRLMGRLQKNVFLS